jgi:hypothetical protein
MAKGLIVPVVSKFDSKGVKQAQSSFKKLGKDLFDFKSIAKGALSAFSVSAGLAFGKSAIQAALEDQKAVASLGQTLKNVGAEFAKVSVNDFVNKLQLATGVSEDQLRPALQQLITVTGDVYKSQDLLKVALDISAGTTKDIDSVTTALSKAYMGNNTALLKLGVSIDKTKLKTMSFNDVVASLSNTYKGQASVAADTYAGKLQILNVAANEAKETIGTGLVDALVLLSSSGTANINNVTGAMDDFATSTADAFRGVADLTKGLFDTETVGGKLLTLLFRPSPLLQYLINRGKKVRESQIPQVKGGERDYKSDNEGAYKLNLKLAEEAKAKARLAALNKKNKKTALELIAEKKAKEAGFTVTKDIDSINAVAAANLQLQAKVEARTQAERDAAQANLDAIKAYQNGFDLALQNAIKNSQTLANPFTNANMAAITLGGTLDMIAGKISSTGLPDIGKVVTPQTAPIVLPTQTPTIDSTFGVSAGGAGTPAPTPSQQINVTVQGSVVSEQELVGTIMGAMNNKLRAGAKFFASAAAG